MVLTHWSNEYAGKWKSFADAYQEDPDLKKEGKVIAKEETLLARNLEWVLTKSRSQCERIRPEKIKNVLLYFHRAKENPPTKTNSPFIVVPINYSKYIEGNFVVIP